MNRSSHASMLHVQANAPHYHDEHQQQQQQQQQQQHSQQQQQQHQHHQQHQHQQPHQREFVEQASPPMSSQSYQRMSMSGQQQQQQQGHHSNSGHYRAFSSHQQPQQQQQQQQHQQHQTMRSHPQPQVNYAQQPYHSSQNHPATHHNQNHHQNHNQNQNQNHSHHQHASSSNHEEHQHQHSGQHYPTTIPIIQSSDPSFIQRPHSRSFSSNSPSHPYPHYATSNSPSQHHQQQQHQPRLHHSVSAGHLPQAGHRSAPVVVGASALASNPGGAATGANTGAGAVPGAMPIKKKDPYATAWRTYSKIADELNLLNADGTLYPISKDAILKYLHHQSKRIKSSNLHWYVNGLKKHQENLGFAWDDVRYDEQVVALLKELTLHPVPIESNTGSGSFAFRPTSSAPIDTSRIASLSISNNQSLALSQQQHHFATQHSQQQQQHQQHPISFAVGSKRQPHQYEEPPPPTQGHQRQQHHLYSERNQPPRTTSHPSSRTGSFHSAPVQLPSQHHYQDDRSAPETPQPRYKSHSHALGEISPAVSTSATSSPMSSSEIQTGPLQQSSPSMSNGHLVKRKRHELAPERISRLVSPTSLEGDEHDEQDNQARGHEDLDGDGLNDMDEDHRERIALKRHASTGTLRLQARASALNMSPDIHLYQRQGDLGQHRDYPVTTPSPGARENEAGGHFRWGSSETSLYSRLSPPGSVSSVGSASPASRGISGGASSSILQRHRRPNGVVSSPISVASASSISNSGAIPPVPQLSSNSGSKTTVQFSDVVEYAQQLQSKYGNRCRDHSWGCVELSEDFHLELTIKMYMDWAGLVASGRLTMDELPDLPEFRRPSSLGGLDEGGSSNDVSPPSFSPPPGSDSVVGDTLKRMTSTPLTTTFGSFTLSQRQSSSPSLKSEEQFNFGRGNNNSGSSLHQRQRSPSGSPPLPIFGQSPKREGYITDSLMSRIGSPPPQHTIPSTPATKHSPSPSNGGMNGGSILSSQLSASPISASRARARKMASSPSLGQHSSFHHQQHRYQRDMDFSAPPQASPPPVPPIPSDQASHSHGHSSGPALPRKSRLGGPASVMSYNSTESSEDMEMSGEEDDLGHRRGEYSIQGQRNAGHHERKQEESNIEALQAADMDEEQMYEGKQEHEQRHHHHIERHHHYQSQPEPKREPELDQEQDDDERDAFLTPAEVRRSGGDNNKSESAVWKGSRDPAQQSEPQHRGHQQYQGIDLGHNNKEEEQHDYATPKPRIRQRRSDHSRRERPWGGVYSNEGPQEDQRDVDDGHEGDDDSSARGGRGIEGERALSERRDFDRIEEVRMGIKSMQSSLSLHSNSEDDRANGPFSDSNADLIATVESSNVPSLPHAHQQTQDQHYKQKQRVLSSGEQGMEDGDEDSSMMEP